MIGRLVPLAAAAVVVDTVLVLDTEAAADLWRGHNPVLLCLASGWLAMGVPPLLRRRPAQQPTVNPGSPA